MKTTTASPPLKGLKDEVVKKVTGLATDRINKVIASQLGDAGKAILGPVVEQGMGALIGVLGLAPDKGPSDTQKILAELAKIKDTLKKMQSELDKIKSGIDMLAHLIVQEAERINQAAKYRDFMDARESIDAKWTIIWSIINTITRNTDDKEKVEKALDFYKSQTVGFGLDILKDVKKMRNAVLKMFDDKESLFDRISRNSIESSKQVILEGIAAPYTSDLITLTRKHEPAIWQKLEEGPCGKAIKEPGKYIGDLGTLRKNWYGDSWFMFMKNAHPVIETAVYKSPLTIFLSEVNMITSKALLMLAIVYRDQEGLIYPANDVIEVNNSICENANSNQSKYANGLHKWLASAGTWGEAPIPSSKRPWPDQSTVFGHWAVFWMHTTTNLTWPCTYVTENGTYYPCSIISNYPNIRTAAEKAWLSHTSAPVLAYYVNDKNKLVTKTLSVNLGKNLPDWFKDLMNPRENPLQKIDPMEDKTLQAKKKPEPKPVLKKAAPKAKAKAKPAKPAKKTKAKAAPKTKAKPKAKPVKKTKAKIKAKPVKKSKPKAKAKTKKRK